MAVAMARICRARGLVLLIADDGRLAARIGAHGIHLPETGPETISPGPKFWGRRRPGWLITAAAHSPRALRRAARSGAHAALLSPVFPTASHPDARPLGALRFARWVGDSKMPVYALGGVSATTAPGLHRSGAVGIAGISGIL